MRLLVIGGTVFLGRGDIGGDGWREEVRATGLSAERERDLLASLR